MVDEEQHVYLTDFGLAKAVLTRAGGTRTGQWVGTLDYVAPEQIRGGRIDASGSTRAAIRNRHSRNRRNLGQSRTRSTASGNCATPGP